LELWRRVPGTTPFQSPPWLIGWWRQFAPGELRVAAAFRRARLAALFPFYHEEAPAGGRLRPLGASVSDYLDVLVDPEDGAAAEALTAILRETSWREWSFEELPADGFAQRLACPIGAAEVLEEHSACPVLPLRGGTDLAGCVPARRRRQLRRAWRAAAAFGEVRIEAGEKDPLGFLEVLFALHGARWGTRQESGVLADAQIRGFHRATLPLVAAAGLTRCRVLTFAGRPAGAYYGFVDRGRAYAYIGGFDPLLADMSPGSILMGHAIEDAISEGAQVFDFLRGREAYKYGWGASDRWNCRRVWTRSPPDA